jgi:hypothetical protein
LIRNRHVNFFTINETLQKKEGRHRSICVEQDNPRLGNTGYAISLVSKGGFDRGGGKNGDIGEWEDKYQDWQS